MPPVYLTSTYVQEAPEKHKGFDYSRSNHPTRLALERKLAVRCGPRFIAQRACQLRRKEVDHGV